MNKRQVDKETCKYVFQICIHPKTMFKVRDNVIMVGKSQRIQEIHTITRTIILTNPLTRFPTHNALLTATGTITKVVSFI